MSGRSGPMGGSLLHDVVPGRIPDHAVSGRRCTHVRRGDRRVFETFDVQFGEWEGFGTEPGVVVEEQWMEGAPKPYIALLES